VFNTLFTMDLWYDLTNFIHLAFVGGNNAGYYITVVLYSMFVPLDMFNLFIRTGYCLEDIPARSHLLNFMFEILMMFFNIYVLITCAFARPPHDRSAFPTSLSASSRTDHVSTGSQAPNLLNHLCLLACRQLQGNNKMRGFVTVGTTASTICTAFLLWKFKAQVIKVRGELAHTLVMLGKQVGKTVMRSKQAVLEDGLPGILPSEKVCPHTIQFCCLVRVCWHPQEPVC
jgi:hypothetical protein